MLRDKLIIRTNDDNIRELVKGKTDEDLNYIDTTNVTDMNGLFFDTVFDGDISKWNTSNVRDMAISASAD